MDINIFSLLMSFSVFIVYVIELGIGREIWETKNVVGLIIFVVSFYLFLDLTIKDFLKINKRALLYLLGTLMIVSISRPIAKSVYETERVNPESAVMLQIFILIFLFYYFGKKEGLKVKDNVKRGVYAHLKIGFLKYTRELMYNYALVFGSVLMVSLVMNSVLFLIFIFSHFYFKEKVWSTKKMIAVCIAVIAITIVTI